MSTPGRTNAGRLVTFAVEHNAALVMSRAKTGNWAVSMQWEWPGGNFEAPGRSVYTQEDFPVLEDACANIISQIEEMT